MGGYRVEFDREICVGSRTCVTRHPESFAFDEAGLPVKLPGAVGLSDGELIRVARGCPAGAVLLFQVDGEEVDPFAVGAGERT